MISNAISVSTSTSWYFFTSLLNRDKTFEKMVLLRKAVIDAKERDDELCGELAEGGNASICSSSCNGEEDEDEVSEDEERKEKLVLLSDKIESVKKPNEKPGQEMYFWYVICFVLVFAWTSLYRLHRLLGAVERSSDADFEMLKRIVESKGEL
jgi:hypothetical protein